MEEKPALSASGPRVLSVAAWWLCLCCGGFLAFYLRLPHPVPGALLLFALLALVLRADRDAAKLSAWENTLLGLFSALFALALVLGFHIVSLAPEKGQALPSASASPRTRCSICPRWSSARGACLPSSAGSTAGWAAARCAMCSLTRSGMSAARR